MGFDEGRIVFNSDTGIYYSGQTVFGKLIFDQGQEKKFRGIYVKIKGFCSVHWRTSHTRTVNGKHETYYVDHSSHEEYINQKTYLIGSEHGEHKIPPGHYEYPFQVMIPANCPSSYEGTHGHVRYEVKVVVDRAFKTDQEKKAVIRVIAPIDLNTEPSVKDPIQMKFDETYYCCCSRSGTVAAVVKLPRGGFVPGQDIPVELGCENSGSVSIDTITLELKKDTKFHAQGSTRSESEVVGSAELGAVRAGGERAAAAALRVPHADAPNLRGCRYIDIDYRIKVTLSPDGCHSDSSQSRNIVIGTIPLVGTEIPQGSPDQITNQNMAVTYQPAPSAYPVGPYPGQTSPYPAPSPYPSNTPYPTGSPYPGATPQPQYPPPYTDVPPTNSPYPVPAPNPYPNTPVKAPYPGAPTAIPYPNTNSPYPASDSPYPTSNAPYPASPTPFPPPSVGNPQFPGVSPAPSGLKTGTLGFVGQPFAGTVPQLPPGAAIPYPTTPAANPYAAASAPQPASPDDAIKPSLL